MSLAVAACGNFFPNPENVVLPSGVRSYILTCDTLRQGDCEKRADAIVEEAKATHPGVRVLKLELRTDGGYTITFSDGSAETMIFN